MDSPLYMTAGEAAAELGVSLPTLYAYVSRGLIRSEARAGSRSRLYRAEDVRALLRRREPAEDPAGPARSLTFGAPVLESAITLISGDRLYYRGRDAVRLAGDARLETVATLIWNVDADPFSAPAPAVPGGLGGAAGAAAGLQPLERCMMLLPVVAAADAAAYNISAGGVAATGARLLRWLAALAAGGRPSAMPVHQYLADAWQVAEVGAGLIRAALVLCADHELNASTFTVRCVAATGATPYAAVLAGLAALSGPRHGGMTERASALLPDLIDGPDPRSAISARLRRGEDLPGFGHPLYPGGDPRGRALLRMLDDAFPGSDDLARARQAAAAAVELAGKPPTIDFALALLARRLNLPAGAALALFAIGRAVGWLGHAAEQYASGQFIRPRARYTGVHP